MSIGSRAGGAWVTLQAVDDEPDAPESREPDDEAGEPPPADSPDRPRRVPKPKRTEEKWFMVGWQREPALEVTVADEQASSLGARAGIAGKLLQIIDELVTRLGGGVEPVVAGARAGNSITFYLDDPQPVGAQKALPVEFTLNAAIRIQHLIDLEGDALFARALEIGPEAGRYIDFVHLLGTTGTTVVWKPRDAKPSELRPDRAGRQYERLTVEPELRQTEMTLIGVLYRVIADPSKVEGSIGIKLAKESPRPPWHKGSWVNVAFNRDALEAKIKDGLIGEAVDVRVMLAEPVPGTGLTVEARHLQLVGIDRRPTPLSIHDLLAEDDD
jgi:hypothetical protein